MVQVTTENFFVYTMTQQMQQPSYKAQNPFFKDNYCWLFFFIADPPHLIKTVRNCWLHSGINGTRRKALCQRQ